MKKKEILSNKNILSEYIIAMGYTDIKPQNAFQSRNITNFLDDIYNATGDIDVNKININKKKKFIEAVQSFLNNNNTIEGLKDKDILLIKNAYESYSKLSVPVSELSDMVIEDMYNYLTAIVKETKYTNLFYSLMTNDDSPINDIEITNDNKYFIYDVKFMFNDGKYVDKKISIESVDGFYELELYFDKSVKFMKIKKDLLSQKTGIYNLSIKEKYNNNVYEIKFLGIIISKDFTKATKLLKSYIKSQLKNIKHKNKITEGIIIESNINYKNFIKELVRLAGRKSLYDMNDEERRVFFKMAGELWDARKHKPVENYDKKFLKMLLKNKQ